LKINIFDFKKNQKPIIKFLPYLVFSLLYFFQTNDSLSENLCKNIFERHPFNSHFLKSPFEKKPEALGDLILYRYPIIPEIFINSDNCNKAERLEAIKDIPLVQIIAAPGHNFPRNPSQVEDLVEHINNNGGGNFQHDPILLNVITDNQGRILNIDLWNAHHRMIAYIIAGKTTLGDLSHNNLTILINGRTVDGEMWDHFVSAAGIDISRRKDFGIVSDFPFATAWTISFDGRISNYELGSRNTMGHLASNTIKNELLRIAVYFGTFDPLHEWHVSVAKQAIKEFNIDEVILVPNYEALHEPEATDINHRLKMISERIKIEPEINLYTANTSDLIEKFGKDPFIERLSQIYATDEIYQLTGSDSYMRLLSEGKIYPDTNRKYIVFNRNNSTFTMVHFTSLRGDYLRF